MTSSVLEPFMIFFVSHDYVMCDHDICDHHTQYHIILIYLSKNKDKIQIKSANILTNIS